MFQNLNRFVENGNGNIFAYKNPMGKNAGLAEHIVCTCISEGRLENNKLLVASSGRFAVEVAKVCKAKGVDFLPMLGLHEDTISFSAIISMGFNIDRTPAAEKEGKIAELRQQGWYYFDQFNDSAMIEHYKSEANKALAELGRMPDVFIDFMGSGATMRGFFEVLKNSTCKLCIVNSSLRDTTKFERKLFIRELIESGGVENVDVQGAFASDLAVRYSQGEFGMAEEVTRSFFTSIKGAQNWLDKNPEKTVLLYWAD